VNREALEQLYTAYGFAVHRRCSRLLGSDAEADDALQEVFLRVERFGTHSVAEPLPWLYTLANHHCFDVLAKRKRIDGSVDAVAMRAAEGSEGPSLERTQLVAMVLANCSVRARDAATLYYVDEMTQDEVANRLGVSRKTVKEKLAQFKTVAARILGLVNGEEAAR